MTAPTATEGGQPFDRSQRAQLRRIGTVVGVLLVGAAVIAVWRNQAIGDSLARAVRNPDWIALVAISVAIVANQVLTSGVFWILMRRHGSVGFQEMNMLVATSTLGNYVPMQAGSIGRMAYHRAVNGIPVRTSLVVILQAMSATAPTAHVAMAVADIACRITTRLVRTGIPLTVRWYAIRPMLPACMGT